MPSVPCIRSIVIDSLEETGLAAGRSLFIFYSKEIRDWGETQPTVTDFARFLGLSILRPNSRAA